MIFIKYLLKILLISILIVFSHQCSLATQGLNATQKQEFVDAHNYYRNLVASGQQSGQPKASNMLEVVWNNDLANVAQNYVTSCPTGHNANRASQQSTFTNVGENLYLSYGSANLNATKAVASWYSEVSSFSSSNINPYKSVSGTGHYTQVVWANSSSIGCGFAQGTDTAKTIYVICNYGEAGNMIGGSIYETGTPCTTCTCSTTHTSLCQSGSSSSATSAAIATSTSTSTTAQNKKFSNKLISQMIVLLTIFISFILLF